MSRPINLSLIAFHFPVTAIVSILHRISGVVLSIGVIYALYLGSLSLSSSSGFDEVVGFLSNPYHSFAIWAILTATGFHIVAGVRHLALDLHIAESLASARISSWFTFLLSAVLSATVAWWIWL